MAKLQLIFHTIIHLRPIQIRFQLWYRLRRMWRKASGFKYPLSVKKEGTPLNLKSWIEKPVSYKEGTYTFLNQQETNPPSGGNVRGALWSYNLNYMDCLLQPGMDKETGLQLINNFIQYLPHNATGIEPYPIALRGINWIKFFSHYSLLTTHYSNSLYAQYLILLNNIEYHLLGNHLLEDGFSLLFGAFYFTDEKLYNKAVEILTSELNEQILDDGGHFELSPMYHQIILDRLLDCINLVQNNNRFENQEQLLSLMQDKAQKMLAWLNAITFSNGEIPLLNDSAPNIAPTTKQLNEYASRLELTLSPLPSALSASGYRRFNGTNYECIMDIGQLGPSYQPGHAHADTFNFVLNVNNKPVIVDTGISTYQANKIRLNERSTFAHNTVTVSGLNSSQVWSSFRVAQRAKVKIIKEDDKKIVASHNGFNKIKAIHQRDWTFTENKIEICDTLSGKTTFGKAHFWLAPKQQPKQNGKTIECKNSCITFKNADSVEVLPSQIPNGYNQFLKNYKIEIVFKNQLITQITTQKNIIQ
jgi:hypothetical protein